MSPLIEKCFGKRQVLFWESDENGFDGASKIVNHRQLSRVKILPGYRYETGVIGNSEDLLEQTLP